MYIKRVIGIHNSGDIIIINYNIQFKNNCQYGNDVLQFK